jgi:hypothetical protein
MEGRERFSFDDHDMALAGVILWESFQQAYAESQGRAQPRVRFEPFQAGQHPSLHHSSL